MGTSDEKCAASSRQRVVLASRSPRRRDLLRLIVPVEDIEVVAPRETQEASFDGLPDDAAIERRLLAVARAKADDVRGQLEERGKFATPGGRPLAVVAADTIVVVSDSRGRPVILGQPPEDDTWQQVVRGWFRDHYAGKTHAVLTGLCVEQSAGRRVKRIVRSEVTFRTDVDPWLEWYLSTGEPRGKAGGYAIQGAGSIFVTRVAGSLSNVIGLPLEALLEVLETLEC
ncbi:MAG: Maf family protein [Planctomycetaceae bacterium]